MDFLERFEQPQDFYGQMSPDQQQAAGQQFQQHFSEPSNPADAAVRAVVRPEQS